MTYFLKRNQCYIYIMLWMLYYLQEMFLLRGIIAQSLFAILMAMSFYAIFALHVNYRLNSYLKYLDVIMVVLTIYGLIPIIGGWSLYNKEFSIVETWISYYYLQRLYMSILPIYTFYYYLRRTSFPEKHINYLFGAFLAFCILMFYQTYTSVSAKYELEEITNNSGFFFVPLIPMLCLLRIKDIWKFLLLVIILFFLVMSMKRGAILAGSVMSVLFIKRHIKSVSLIHLVYISFLSIGALLVVYMFVADQYAVSDYFQVRVAETLSGNTSGRDVLYKSFWSFFIERTSALEFLIGNGANATRVLFGQYAHNDWLEFAIDQGVLGVMLYFFYWCFFVEEWMHYCGPLEYKRVLGDMVLIYFLISLYSMSFDGMPFIATFCIAYCMVNNNIYRKWLELQKG